MVETAVQQGEAMEGRRVNPHLDQPLTITTEVSEEEMEESGLRMKCE